MQIDKKVLEKVLPSQEEDKKIRGAAERLAGRISEEIRKQNLKAKPVLVGSVAKGTYLKTKPEIDVFVQFPRDLERRKLEEYGLAIGKAVLSDIELRYAEHPYTHGRFEGYEADVVPCYEISDPSQKMSAVDRTPFHTEYIQRHLKEAQRKEVLLFKQFLKGIGIYGAEEEIQGFSGYLCELIILKYGTFRKAIAAGAEWKHGETIVLENVKHPWFDSPLTFIDPVDPNRNVASALSPQNFDLFVKACREYLANPRMEFFFPNPVQSLSIDELRRRINERFIVLIIPRPGIVSDTLFPQIRKCIKALKNLCEDMDFKVKRTGYHVDNKITILLEFVEEKLPETLIHRGPPEKDKGNVARFIRKWKDNPRVVRAPFVEKGVFYVEIKREFTRPAGLIRDRIYSLNTGKHLMEAIRKGYKLNTGAEIVQPEYAEFLTKYLERKCPWEW